MDVPVARASADLRLLRAAVFTAACVALSAAGHVLAAGAGVPWWAVGAAAALVFALAVPLAGRERSLPGVAAGLAVGQSALHALYGSAQWASGAGGRGQDDAGVVAFARSLLCNDAARPLTAEQARQVLDDAGLGGLAAGHAGHPGPDSGVTEAALGLASWPMLLAHLTAALAAGWLLRRGDAALWLLVRLSATAADGLLLRALRSALACLRLLCGAAVPHAPGVRPGTRDEAVPPAPGALRHSVVRRGPPRTRDLVLTA
ncbi:hypothetical protein V1J52_17435 [Streptomyces sp. TRM 70351]|uniref:hypothetical protein n=1 Tax=Streptomyces sp. TRM 70351 TaxID=3116552 RepID=UPI002E7AECD4|nr:hypothetical protein [Streptomyces sp. TRM 70351]MEE1929944.1 hypothetical protein [Streptomyces sp. TRM 70351]